jgi:alcohol dehydrogenase (NADP+)
LEEEDYAVIKEIGQKYVKRFNNPSMGWEVPLYEGLDGV